MPLSMYQASVPVFTQMLSALSSNLDKAAAHAADKKIDPAALLTARLFPDMHPLTRQVQIATDQAKGATARLGGVEVPKYADTEATFDELKARVAKTLDFIKSVPASAIDGSEDRDINFLSGGRERTMKGQPYLLSYVLPNFFFHVTTAYAILRHNGVELGKRHFMSA
jgi:hypothetical protein